MEIKLEEKDAKNLLRMVVFAKSVAGYMSDFIDDPAIATRSRLWTQVEHKLLKEAYEAGLTDMVEKDEDQYYVKSGEFESMMNFTDEFEELSLHQKLANKLAWRDFYEAHSSEEIEQMQADGKTYFGVELHPFEERYWDEFAQYEYARLRVDTQEVDKP